jgi:cysteine desulfurase family protein
MIYFDNAATSYPKPDYVYEEINSCLKDYCANPGRGGHSMSVKSGERVLETRENIANFFNIKNPTRIAFTKNATESINIGIKGILENGNHVITTSMEHNSVIRPLKQLEKDKKIKLSVISGNQSGEINISDFEKAVKKETKLIVTTLSSNVNGIIMPIKKIGDLAKKYSIKYLLDASQGAGTLDIDVDKMNIDLLAFTGHKCLLGPQGIGGIYISDDVNIKSFIEGGTGTDSYNLYQPDYMPELIESGTLNTPGIVGLNAGIKFINLIGKSKIRNHKQKLVSSIINGLEEFEEVEIYSKNDIDNNSGIVSFKIYDYNSSEIAYVLDKLYSISVRSGLHCAPLAHKTLGTFENGLVRVSFSYFNKIDEVEKILFSVKDLIKQIKEK